MPADFTEKLRILQLETLYDLALALHAQRGEGELVQELLERVCGVLDPAAAAAVTRDPYGSARAAATVGWHELEPSGADLLADPVWQEVLTSGQPITRTDGQFAGLPFRELVAAPLVYRGVFLGYLALLDKEARGGEGSSFRADDRRFLDSVAALAGVSLDSARQVEQLETRSEQLAEENKALKDGFRGEVAGKRIVAHAPPMRRVLEIVERVAPRGVSVLLRGESGTGKDLVAKLLHLLSGRSGPLVGLNCAALPESLLESELFGIEGGVATGVQARRGKFELAQGGTLFLDEIGDMHPQLQAKLLRALQEREIVRLGGQHAIPVDVRLVAATHRNLEALFADGRFREDLYYRLKGVEVELPPLRDRREDIPHLVRHFVEEFCRRESLPVPQIAREALALLLAYDYPGNVRELQNVVEGAVSLADGVVELDLVRSLMGAPSPGGPEPLDLNAVERLHIQRVLRLTAGNRSAAAKILGLDRRTLQRKGF
jgi:transcriptional regulator with GAF, ATPase, and Fis domain